ncbi:MAG: DEAD/DEAH box helicase family protein [Candidatus Polarisedimenticolaceae bacterium]|nr:DEAD/DEAH box helicase family protein [Candidatus Polarisedimenticolaceae bacterium]
MTMQSENFEFIRRFRPELADLGGYAEAILHIDPGSAQTRLRSLAETITKAIHRQERLPFIPQASFYDLLRAESFIAVVDRSLINHLDYLRRQGNDTAHGGKGDLRTASKALGVGHQLVSYMAMKYHGLSRAQIPDFKVLQDKRIELKQLQQSVKEYKEALDSKAQEVDNLLDKLDQANTQAQQTQAESSESERHHARQQSQQTASSLAWDEAQTRQLLIDEMLERAGWNISDTEQVTLEHPVEHQPTASGRGYADYVLWDDSGKPLAVIEAKKSSVKGLQIGREQARIYADGLEKIHGQRPVIFYTNGYETYLWDDSQYNSYRQVYGFYSRDSLNYLIYQRSYRESSLEQNNPKREIADRAYQIEAIKAVASRFQQQRRKALIVQATGTGKTRVAIAISELLTRTGWAKRVLFLCDRRELRRQADTAFKDYLPSEPRCVVGEGNKIDENARIFVATYPGMMGRFHQLDVGFFDLIIADESHRSIYNKYREIFLYFDALQLGLTATPVKYIARNTFDLFACEDQDPTFEYSLDDAIKNEPPYLVPFRVKELTTEFLRQGIHYNDLSKAQQRQLEQDLGEEEAKVTTIKGKDIGRKLYSTDTDRIILKNLIDNGIKDATGSLVGKTIVFAQSQGHAEHLEQLFTRLYPQYGTRVCKVIHNKVSRADALIDEFKAHGNDFRIAISVDMLDTGIDVPEVVNLVFAKPVRSWVKFWQMIGRGTRLCLNLFGAGRDKSEFYIFDHYGNFAFFEEAYKEVEEQVGKSLLQQLFEVRLGLLDVALKQNHKAAFDVACELIRRDLQDLPDTSISIKHHLRSIHQLTQTDALATMGATTRNTLAQTMAPLMGSRVLRDREAIAFDRLVGEMQRCFVQQAACFDDLKQQLLIELSTLAVNIQVVRQKEAVLNQVQTAEFWRQASIDTLEWLRTELRGIMKYRQSGTGPGDSTQTTGVKEEGETYEVERKNILSSETEGLQYRRRIKKILDQMLSDNPVLQKIHRNQPVSVQELERLTSTILTQHPGVDIAVLNQFYQRTAQELHTTIRELIGMDANAVENHFTQFLHAHPQLNHKQVQFMNLLKQYISEHGTIEAVEKLYDAPFTSISHEGIDGVFSTADADDLVTLLRPFWGKRQELRP